MMPHIGVTSKKDTTMPHIGVTSKKTPQNNNTQGKDNKSYDAEIQFKPSKFSPIALPATHSSKTNPPNSRK
jgi:hypothetical protein